MNPASMPDPDLLEHASEEQRNGSFHHAALWKRSLIVFAGPATNVLVALAIFASFNLIYGKFEASNAVGGFAEISAGKDAGLEIGDTIRSIDGNVVENFNEIAQRVMMFPGERVELIVERDGSELTIPVTIGDFEEADRFGNMSRIGRIGVYSSPPEVSSVGLGEALALSVDQSMALVRMMVTGVGQILTGDRSVKELGGPIKIAKYSGEQLSLGTASFVSFAALISLNLAFINLLPIPALDGGHLAFYAAEAIRRKPVGARGQELAYRTGVALVLALMLFVTVNDLISLPIFGS
jgi:regulator of sigma E protease